MTQPRLQKPPLASRRTSRVCAPAVAFVSLLFLIAGGGPAQACACCTNDGQRLVGAQKMDSFASALLAEIRFANAAQLYTGEAEPQSLPGVAAASPDFDLSVAKQDGAWVFTFRQERDGNGGTLTFTLPKTFSRFEVDPRDPSAAPSGLGPALYKEWRLTAPARGTGVLSGATGGDQKATLVLHGRGNSCTDASQFSAWTLVLDGPKATSTLFGALVAP